MPIHGPVGRGYIKGVIPVRSAFADENLKQQISDLRNDLAHCKKKMALLGEAIEINGDVDPALLAGWIEEFHAVETQLNLAESNYILRG